MGVTSENRANVKKLFLVGVLLGLLVPSNTSAASSYKTLGTDQSGETAPFVDLTALKVRRAGASLEVRIEFVDLPPVSVDGTTAGWYFTRDSGSKRFLCCHVEVLFGVQPQYRMTYGWDECPNCTKEKSLEGTYNAEEEAVSIFVPLRLASLQANDLISGCGRSNDELPWRRCGSRDDFSAHGSIPVFGSDTLITTRVYKIPRR